MKLYEKNGNDYLAVSTGLAAKAFIGTNTAKLKAAPGKLILGDEIFDWNIEGFTEIDGIMYFYGPYVEGATLDGISINESLLSMLLAAFRLLNNSECLSEQFSLSSVCRLTDGGLLFFPAALTDFINSRTADQKLLTILYPWNHPDYTGEQAQSFTIAALVYELVCGVQAFPGKVKEDIRRAMKARNYASPLTADPRLRPDLVTLIDKSFAGTASTDEWRRMLTLLKKEGRHDDSITDAAAEEIAASAEKEELLRRKRNKAKGFLKNHRAKLIGSAAAAVVLLMIIVPAITRALAPPVTVGMEKPDVIKLYYDSYSLLDFETMEDCITKQAGKDDVNSIVSLTAITKARTAYEGDSGLIDVNLWISEGMPELQQGTMLWGISDFSIKKVSPEDTFAVYYTRWNASGSEDSSVKVTSEEIEDILHLSFIRNAWVIDELERTFLKNN